MARSKTTGGASRSALKTIALIGGKTELLWQLADMWFECLTEGCHGVRFASGQVQADTEAVETER